MRMPTFSFHPAYSGKRPFSSLPREMQKAALERYRYTLAEDLFDAGEVMSAVWEVDHMHWDAKESDIRYTLGGDQGSGAVMDIRNDDLGPLLEEIWKKYPHGSIRAPGMEALIDGLNHGGVEGVFETTKNSFATHYNHNQTVDLDVEFDLSEEWRDDNLGVLEWGEGGTLDSAIDALKDEYIVATDELFRMLEAEYDRLTEDETLADHFDINEIEFDCQGRIV